MSAALAKLLRDNPIVVTGMGALSSAGESATALWDASARGQSLAAWREFKAGGVTRRFAVCSAPAFDAARPELQPVRKMDRCAQLAWLAACQAWSQARMDGAYPAERVGVMVGSSRGPFGKSIEPPNWLGRGLYAPSTSAGTTFASVSGVIAQALKLKGPGATISTTCASSAFSMALAAEQILLGKADAMLAGGAEAPLHHSILAQLRSADVLGFHAEAGKACRPFDAARNGTVLGEGGAFLVLESARAAAARGALPLARFTSWSMSVDNSGRTGVDDNGSGLLRTMEQALELAGLPADKIDYINAHGTGTKINDAAEARAVCQLLGPRAANIPCSSTKPVTGHCLGATSALEAVICIKALERQTIPPTASCAEIDPRCPINPQPLNSRPASIANVMSNSIGFWGYHAALIFSAARPVQ